LFLLKFRREHQHKKAVLITKENAVESDQQVLVYVPLKNKTPAMAGFEEEMENLKVAENVEICQTIASLSRRLRRFEDRPGVVVLLAPGKGDLSELLAIRSLFRGLRLILLLPDREPETISKGHTLMPRFLAYCDGNFGDVAAVLKKMLKA
jgi:hypothetical protein